MSTSDHDVVSLAEHYGAFSTRALQREYLDTINERRRYAIEDVLRERGAKVPELPTMTRPAVVSDDVLERVARSICTGMGMNPDEIVRDGHVSRQRWKTMVAKAEERIARGGI